MITNRHKTWLTVGGLLAQMLGIAYWQGVQAQIVRDEISGLRRDLTRYEGKQSTIEQATRDIAVLQAKDIDLEKQINRLVDRK